jgi:hypothetical protein
MSQNRFKGKHTHVNDYASFSRNEQAGRGPDTAKVVAAAKRPVFETVRTYTQHDRQNFLDIFKIKFPPTAKEPRVDELKGTDATSLLLGYLQIAQPKAYERILSGAGYVTDPQAHEKCLRKEAQGLLISAGLHFMLKRGFDLQRAYDKIVVPQTAYW